MLPVFTVAMARDAVARQFDYDDHPTPPAADRIPAAAPRRRPSAVRALRHRLAAPFVRTTWSPTR